MGFSSGWLARATFRASLGSQEVVNAIHYNADLSDTIYGLELQSLADRLTDDLMALYRAFFPNTWTIDPIVVTEEIDPLSPSDPREQVTGGAGGAGTRWGGPMVDLPYEMCALAQLRTAKIGRSFRGRMFLPPAFSEDELQGNQTWREAAGSYMLACQNFLDAIPREPDLVTGPSGAVVQWHVYSRTRRGRSQSDYSNEVTSVTLSDRIFWLRSRGD